MFLFNKGKKDKRHISRKGLSILELSLILIISSMLITVAISSGALIRKVTVNNTIKSISDMMDGLILYVSSTSSLPGFDQMIYWDMKTYNKVCSLINSKGESVPITKNLVFDGAHFAKLTGSDSEYTISPPAAPPSSTGTGTGGTGTGTGGTGTGTGGTGTGTGGTGTGTGGTGTGTGGTGTGTGGTADNGSLTQGYLLNGGVSSCHMLAFGAIGGNLIGNVNADDNLENHGIHGIKIGKNTLVSVFYLNTKDFPVENMSSSVMSTFPSQATAVYTSSQSGFIPVIAVRGIRYYGDKKKVNAGLNNAWLDARTFHEINTKLDSAYPDSPSNGDFWVVHGNTCASPDENDTNCRQFSSSAKNLCSSGALQSTSKLCPVGDIFGKAVPATAPPRPAFSYVAGNNIGYGLYFDKQLIVTMRQLSYAGQKSYVDEKATSLDSALTGK